MNMPAAVISSTPALGRGLLSRSPDVALPAAWRPSAGLVATGLALWIFPITNDARKGENAVP